MLAAEARFALGREAIRLARRALEVWPDCAEACLVLADRAPDAERALPLFAAAMAAAERVPGPEAAGTYLARRSGLAETLITLGRKEEAAGHLRELLRLDPGDGMGAFHLLADLLLDLDRDDEATELLDRYPDEELAGALLTRALLAFRREGDSSEARRRLRRGVKANPLLPRFFLGYVGKAGPAGPEPSEGHLGRVFYSRSIWERTPGALGWLEERAGLPRRGESGKESRRPHRRAKKKRRR